MKFLKKQKIIPITLILVLSLASISENVYCSLPKTFITELVVKNSGENRGFSVHFLRAKKQLATPSLFLFDNSYTHLQHVFDTSFTVAFKVSKNKALTIHSEKMRMERYHYTNGKIIYGEIIV